jgi:hypothetical protein
MERAPLLVFGVGCAKTGTNSLSGMFERHYRSAHEPQADALIDLILEQQKLSRAQFRQAVRDLLDPLDLEVNASQLNGYIVRTLVALYPRAMFVLTLRDPKAWLHSFANHQRNRAALPVGSAWARFRDLRFGDGETADPNAIYPMDRYFRYWLEHNARVIKTVPSERLLVIRTENLDAEIPRLAAFLRVPESTIAQAHANQGNYAGGDASPFDDGEVTRTARRYATRLRSMTGLVL